MTLPYNIVNGQAIDATPVMANFNSLDGRSAVGGAVAAASGANADITSLSGLTTPLPINEGGTGATTAAAAQAAINAAPVPVAQGGTGDSGTQWSTQTVTPTAQSGTLTTASATWRFKVIGKTAFFNLICGITTNGTGATAVNVPLPTGWTGKSNSAFGGLDMALGPAVFGRCYGATAMQLIKYDGSYPGANGAQMVINGVLELT